LKNEVLIGSAKMLQGTTEVHSENETTTTTKRKQKF
jgi:hypothetical protein